MNKKCYIAGKISGLPKEVYEAHFRQAALEVKALGYDPVVPIDLPHDHDKSWEAYMREDLRAMLDCQAVFAMRGWSGSEGATLEVNLADKLRIPVIEQGHFFTKIPAGV